MWVLIWSKGKNVPKATKAQMNNLSQIIKQVLNDAPEIMSKIQNQECRDVSLEIVSKVRELRPHSKRYIYYKLKDYLLEITFYSKTKYTKN